MSSHAVFAFINFERGKKWQADEGMTAADVLNYKKYNKKKSIVFINKLEIVGLGKFLWCKRNKTPCYRNSNQLHHHPIINWLLFFP